VMSKPAVELRKSRPDLMPLDSMLCAVFCAIYIIRATNPMIVISWYKTPLTFSFLNSANKWQPFGFYLELKILDRTLSSK